MLKFILKAAENFCIHQIRLPYVIDENTDTLKTFIAHIDINTVDSKTYRIYIAGEKSFIQKVSEIFLEEEESDEETLIDMTLEITNLIVGSAKVIAKNEKEFNIGTPNFMEISNFNYEYDDIRIINIEEYNLIIAIKELN